MNMQDSRFRTFLLKVKSIALAHKIVVACVIIGIAGGLYGMLAGLGAGSFIELVVNRIREEKIIRRQREAFFQMRENEVSGDELQEAYQVLGLSEGASFDEVKSAHRHLAAKYHPDGEHGDSERFQQIQAAYETVRKAFKDAQ